MMSFCTFTVAVAVRAMMGRLSPMALMMGRRRRYSGRKSWPHSDMQCASSMATKEIFRVRKNSTVSSLVSDSGAT